MNAGAAAAGAAGTAAAASTAASARRWPLLLGVFVFAFAAHAVTIGNGFAFDDPVAIVDNPVLRGAFDLGEIFRKDFWGRGPGDGPGTWRPLVVLAFRADLALGGGAPWIFHLNNALWHALASLLVVLVLLRHARDRRLAWLAGVVFASLAVNSEAVAGIVSRADVMAVAFTLLALWVMPAADEPLRPLRLLAVVGSLLAGLLCKESALAGAVWLLVAELILPAKTARPRRVRALRAVVLVVCIAVAVGAYVGLRASLYGGAGAPVQVTANNNPLLDEPFTTRLATSARLVVLALERIVAPFQLAPDYSHAAILPSHSLAEGEVLLGCALVAALAVLAWWLRRRAPAASFGVVVMLLSFGAMSHLVVPLPQIFSERLLYAPAIGFAIVVASATLALATRARALAYLLVALLVAGNFARGVARDLDWKDSLTLFSQAVRDVPRSGRAWLALGLALRGEKRPAEAVPALRNAIAIMPKSAGVKTTLGITLDELGQRAEAEVYLREALSLDIDDHPTAVNLAIFFGRRGRHAEGAAVLRRHIGKKPPCDKLTAGLLERLEADAERRRPVAGAEAPAPRGAPALRGRRR